MIKCSLNSKKIVEILSSVVDSSVEEFQIDNITSIDFLSDSSVVFIKRITQDLLSQINKYKDLLVVTENPQLLTNNYITVKNTRLEMAKLLSEINNTTKKYDDSLYFVSENVQISDSVIIEPFVFIDDNVIIGENSIIKSGSKIFSKTIIGKNSIIRENSVVGGQGFGVEKDELGNNFKIPHLGGVVIGDFVEVGALNTIVSGTINPTIIMDYTKIDDHVHIAHNCKIGKNCIITAGTIFSGSVELGDNSWTGPNSSIKNSLQIAKNTLIGIGSVVTKNILIENSTYAGNPAKEFKQYLDEKRKNEFFLDNYDKFNKLISEVEK
jgi:UDP-3-O-[3-hydroxymyristoyl] glucosamine N-acyltransferase